MHVSAVCLCVGADLSPSGLCALVFLAVCVSASPALGVCLRGCFIRALVGRCLRGPLIKATVLGANKGPAQATDVSRPVSASVI